MTKADKIREAAAKMPGASSAEVRRELIAKGVEVTHSMVTNALARSTSIRGENSIPKPIPTPTLNGTQAVRNALECKQPKPDTATAGISALAALLAGKNFLFLFDGNKEDAKNFIDYL